MLQPAPDAQAWEEFEGFVYRLICEAPGPDALPPAAYDYADPRYPEYERPCSSAGNGAGGQARHNIRQRYALRVGAVR